MIPIRLEGANGLLEVDAQYDVHDLLRPFQIAYGGYWYEQNRTEGETWIYRQRSHQLRGSMPDDPAVTAMTPYVPTPALTALVPATATLGDPSFTLHVQGTGFSPTSIIVFGGEDEPTIVVSPEEVTTGVDMSVWKGPDPAIPVLVKSGTTQSNALMFAMQAGATQTATTPAWPMPGWNANG